MKRQQTLLYAVLFAEANKLSRVIISYTHQSSRDGKTVSFRARASSYAEKVCLEALLRKEVIQPQVPLRLPCYDFTPIISHTVGACFP